MRKFFFKKTLSGLVLMVYYSRPSRRWYGETEAYAVKATEEDASNFTKELSIIAYKEQAFDEIKKNNPELLI